jgi:hypothetical protein
VLWRNWRHSGGLSECPPLIIGTKRVDDHQAALLADELLARIVYDHNLRRGGEALRLGAARRIDRGVGHRNSYEDNEGQAQADRERREAGRRSRRRCQKPFEAKLPRTKPGWPSATIFSTAAAAIAPAT